MQVSCNLSYLLHVDWKKEQARKAQEQSMLQI